MAQRRLRPEPPPLAGETVGKYEIVKEIGRGAMACVYLARDTFTEREVAVKIANPDPGTDDKRSRIARKLFFNEAKAAGLLQHPNIVELFDAGVQNDIRYLVMEYVPGGGTLHDYTQEKTLLPVDEVVNIMLKCVIAFDYAHRKGVIHRDIKPKNILVDERNDVKIADFGVAMVTELDLADTQVTGYLGSPMYMSPEQLRGETVTTQVDLFALGVVMYELLTGRHPFGAPTVAEIVQKISREPHISVSKLRPDVPEVLSRIIDRTLKKHPAGRYGTGLDIAGDLSLIFDHISVNDTQVSGQQRFAAARGLEFFEVFHDAEVWEVLNSSVWSSLAAGTEIVGPDQDVDSFYVLVEGEVRIQRGLVRIETLEAGSCFGEIGYLSRAERTASAIARSNVTVMQIRRSLIEQATPSCRLNLHRAFLAATTTRLARATGRIVELEASQRPA
ncbi:MAG: serine/threonine protein kinase [Gammaproteobacteria bacterium]|jgi:serine/threonine protein kinase